MIRYWAGVSFFAVKSLLASEAVPSMHARRDRFDDGLGKNLRN